MVFFPNSYTKAGIPFCVKRFETFERSLTSVCCLNSVFFLNDYWWNEDRHWTRRPGLSKWLIYLTLAASVVLRIFHNPTQPLRALAACINWNP